MSRSRHLRSVALASILALCVSFTACDDDPTAPSQTRFSLAVTASLPDGTPVEDLEVVVWNLSSSLSVYLQDSLFRRRAATTVEFSLASPGTCWLEVTDLEGRIVESAIEGTLLPAGQHSIVLGASIPYRSGVEVYRYELVVRDPDSGTERFREARFMTAVHLDRTRLVTDATDADGRVVIDDPTCVPGLYELPALSAVDEGGDPTGSFVLDDSLTIGVFDDAGHAVYTRRAVVNGPNRIEIRWEPSMPGFSGASDAMLPPVTPRTHSIVPGLPVADRLEQNRPNPFN